MTKEVRQRIDAIFRPDPPEKEMLLAGMAHWAKELDQQFLAIARRRARAREALAPSLKNLRQQLQTDVKAEKVRAALRKFRPPKLTPARAPKHVDRIFGGSFGATYGPPYDVQWTWSQQQGDPPSPQVSADADSGTMQLLVQTLDDSSAVAARAAVGNWLTAPLGTSTMNIYAAPAFSWWWAILVYLNWAESAGWLGFVVQSFDIHSGNFIETVLQQQIPVWDSQLSTLGDANNAGSTTGYPLQAQFTAIEGLFYTIWIWFGVYAAEGDNCDASFWPVTVPFFTWENG